MNGTSLSLINRIVDLDRTANSPLYSQLSEFLREAILDGTLPRGTRLPATRSLANSLEVSRNTVVEAFNKLHSEGYLESQVGAGTFVSEDLPEQYTQVQHPPLASESSIRLHENSSQASSLSDRAAQLRNTPLSLLDDPVGQLAFRPGVPAFDAFPIETWSKLASRRWRSLPPSQLEYGNPAGYPPLRKAVAKYLRTSRGVRCEADQVLIVSGVQQAITLVARTLLDPEDEVYVEDPGFPRMQAAFASTGAQVSPVRIDEQGFSPAAVDDSASPCLVGVTPSNHYPLGITMSPSRRMDLLEWCALNDTWILEDDYDSEFQYSGRPFAALQGMDHVGRVLYTGTFSKVLFPALRIGYLVVPSNLVSPIKKMRSVTDRCTPRVPQMVLTDFITEGYLEEHIRQMRTLYADRQAALIEALRSEFPSFIEIESNDAGLHLVGRLPKHVDDKAVSDQLAEHNIVALPLSFYAEHPLERGGLLLGYAGLPSEQIVETVRTMKDLLEPFLS